MKRSAGQPGKQAGVGNLDLDDLNELEDEEEFLEEGEELMEEGEEDEGNQSGGSTHSLHSNGSSHSLQSNGSSSNLSKSRVHAIMTSHKKTMRRSASAPNVARDDLARKRNRTTPEQLMILEEAFAKNPTPNAQLRDHLAEKVDMTGRSVQIWFQNRRAKEKKTNRGSAGTADHPLGGIKAPMGSFAAHFQQLQPSFHGGPHFDPATGKHFVMTTPSALSTVTPASLTSPAPSSSSLAQPGYAVPPHMRQPMPHSAQSHPGPGGPAMRQGRSVFNVDRLKIGTWTRLTITSGDLLCKIDPAYQTMCWEIIEGPHRCKIEFSFANMASIDLQVVNDQVSLLTVMLAKVPSFFLEVRLPDGKPAWKACNDITEDQQASRHSKHVIQARTSILNHFLAPLMTSDPYLSTVSSFKNQATFTPSPQPLERAAPAAALDSPRPDEPDYLEQEAEKTMKKSYSVPAISINKPVTQFAPLDDTFNEYLTEEVLGTSLEFTDFGYQGDMLNSLDPADLIGATLINDGFSPLS